MATAVLEITAEQKKLLNKIKKDSKTDGFTVVPETDDVKAIYEAGLLDRVETVDGDAGKLKVWVKAKGASATPEEAMYGAMEQEFPLLEIARGGKRTEQFPFSKMNVGDSFLIPVTEAKPEPWISFASTVTSASRRNSHKSETEFITNKKNKRVPKTVWDKRFTLRRVTKGDTYPNGKTEVQSGARVYRYI